MMRGKKTKQNKNTYFSRHS